MRVVVLMSTYQGERFVAEQLDSILLQLPADGHILIRDDGSQDATIERIAACSDRRISLTRGANIGFLLSFLSLIESVPAGAEMVMLADQDDIWLPGKLDRAVRYLQGREAVPTLYCSRLELVDIDLKPLGLSPAWPRAPSFRNALTENVVTGCTAAFNRAVLDLMKDIGNPKLIHFHDWWLYLVVSAFGEVYFDPEPTILYRQHGSNAIGMRSGFSHYWVILRFLRKQSWFRIMFNQIENFRAVYGACLSADQRYVLDRYFEPRSPLAMFRLLVSPVRYRQTLSGDVRLRALLAFEILIGRGVLSNEAPGSRRL